MACWVESFVTRSKSSESHILPTNPIWVRVVIGESVFDSDSFLAESKFTAYQELAFQDFLKNEHSLPSSHLYRPCWAWLENVSWAVLHNTVYVLLNVTDESLIHVCARPNFALTSLPATVELCPPELPSSVVQSCQRMNQKSLWRTTSNHTDANWSLSIKALP